MQAWLWWKTRRKFSAPKTFSPFFFSGFSYPKKAFNENRPKKHSSSARRRTPPWLGASEGGRRRGTSEEVFHGESERVKIISEENSSADPGVEPKKPFRSFPDLDAGSLFAAGEPSRDTAKRKKLMNFSLSPSLLLCIVFAELSAARAELWCMTGPRCTHKKRPSQNNHHQALADETREGKLKFFHSPRNDCGIDDDGEE